MQHVVDFDAVSDTNMVINFVISAEKITYGNSTHDAGWMVS
ncbi:MAG: type VI secretion system tube protein TssD [Capnocytophaga granulosa]